MYELKVHVKCLGVIFSSCGPLSYRSGEGTLQKGGHVSNISIYIGMLL